MPEITVMTQKPTEGFLYEQIAKRISNLIEVGVYPQGRRLPSIRNLCKQMHISKNTAVHAYRWLELRGVLEPRPKAGYYVRTQPLAPRPSPAKPQRTPVAVSVHKMVQEMERAISDPRLVPLGSATVDPRLLPLTRLNRLLSSAIRRAPEIAHSYTEPAGLASLRIQIARLTADAGTAFGPDEVVVTSGAQEALHLALEVVCRPKDAVAVEAPVYYGILQAIEALGLRAIEIPAHPSEGMDVGALYSVVKRHNPKAVVAMPTCNNPLGSSMHEEKKKEIIRMLTERRIPLIEDDTSGGLHFDNVRPPPAKAYDTRGMVLYCSSISKVLSPGLRVGWIAAGRFRAEVEHRKTFRTSCNPTSTQMAVAEYFEEGAFGRHLTRLRDVLVGQMDLMASEIRRTFPKDIHLTHPSGGFQLWIELPTRINALEMYRAALKEGITTVPGPFFSARNHFQHHMRLSAGRWSERVQTAVGRLGQMLRDC